MDVGHYTLVGRLPDGRLGTIWCGRDVTGKLVALKLLVTTPWEGRVAVRRRIAAVESVVHPHLVANHEPVEDADGLWLVEDWVDGVGLALVLDQLSLPQALGIAHGILSGLAALHGAGISHGAMAPHSVLVGIDGAPRIDDVGAWAAAPGIASTPRYASPELDTGQPPDSRADVYATGVLLSELLTGPRAPAGDVPAVLARATCSDPAARQADAAVLLNDLERAGYSAYGPSWWTTEGVGALVAAQLGLSDRGPAAPVPAATPVLGGSREPVPVTAAGRSPRRTRSAIAAPLAAGVAAVVAIGAVAVALDRTPGMVLAGRGTESSAAAPAPGTSATPTPTPPGGTGFAGSYVYRAVVTRSNVASIAVGSVDTETWTVSSTCTAKRCTAEITVDDGAEYTFRFTHGVWRATASTRRECYNYTTPRTRQDYRVSFRRTGTFEQSQRTDDVVEVIAGVQRDQQLDPCRVQTVPLYDVTKRVTITRTG